ncbi:amino acid ABC transporter substrate-binding protein [Massilia sp. W12]|uniref:amino acid ABC transporter substrate-binding protein n=1 Tax=Massilia sp. W12 TaxID=3126507 RepID=UPI0030D5717C
MKRFLCALVLPAVLGLSLQAQADTLSKIRGSQKIVLAHREASIPFSYLDESKKPVGYSVELCLKVVEAIKRELKLPKLEVQWLMVTPSDRVAALTEGRADLECGSTTNNAERRKQVAFTIPHFIATTRMVTLQSSGVKNWGDLRDKRVVTTKGTTVVKVLQSRDKHSALAMKLMEGADHAQSFGMVERGEADAFPMDDVLLYGLRAKSKLMDKLIITGDPLSAEPYAIMMRKDDAPFKSLVDKEMSRIIFDGELNKVYEKWFMKPIPPSGLSLAMPMGFLLRESLRFPSDKVAD